MSEKEKKEFYVIKKEIYELLMNSEYFTIYLGKADVYKLENNEKIYIKKNILITLKEILNSSDEETRQNISKEIKILSLLNNNNNIVKMIDIVEIEGKNYIAFEYCNGEDLRKYMDYFQYFDENLVQIILMQIVNGLIDLFKKNIVHHDIKPENILLNFYDVPEVNIKDIKEILKSDENKNLLLNLINNNNQFYQIKNLQNNQNINNNINMINNSINDMSRSMNNLNYSIKNLSIVSNNLSKINNYKYNQMLNANKNVKMNMNVNVRNSNNINNNNNFCSRIHNIEKRDIMTQRKFLNILKESADYKLSNFSFATLKSDISKRNICGTPLYMAPELFKFDSKLSEIENKKVDIWALGILAYELLFGKRPFEGFSIEEISEMYDNDIYTINLRINEGKNKRISKEFFYFLNKCLQKDPEKRANIYELLNSDFLIYDNETLEKMDEIELRNYLKGIVEVDLDGNFILNINKDYEEEIKNREINRIWIDNN